MVEPLEDLAQLEHAGLNAGVLAIGGSAITQSGGSISTTGTGASGGFASGSGSSLTLTNVTITATADGGHGVMATQGGSVTVNGGSMTTSGAHGAPLATDRGGAVELPEYAVDTLGRRGWYSLTRSMRADLADIDRRCNRDSWLAESLRSNAATHFVVASHVNAALTAVGEDGVFLGHKRANELLLGERHPRTAEEQLLLNTHRVMWELEELADQRCTPELIRSILHARVAVNAPQRTPSPPGLEIGSWRITSLEAEATLQYVARFVNGEGVDPDDHPISYALGLLITFTSGRPLPPWNGLMSVLLTRLLFLKSRLPVVAMIPIAPVYRAWQNGVIVPPIVPVALHDSLIPVGDEFDFTLFDATAIHLSRMELDATETAIRRALASDETMTRALATDRRVNHRQRGVLSAALSEPETVFRIDTHQQLYRVAYSTARADLLGLVDLGLLTQVRRGPAFVFAPVAGFRQRVRNLTAKPVGLR